MTAVVHSVDELFAGVQQRCEAETGLSGLEMAIV